MSIQMAVPVPGATLRRRQGVSGIPGVPAGMVHLAQRYGKLHLRQLLAPAIALARNGFHLDGRGLRASPRCASRCCAKA